MSKKPGLEPGFLLDELLVRSVPKPEVLNGLGRVPLAQWMSAVRSRHRLPPAMRAYQTSGHLPVAVVHAFVIIRPTTGVGTTAHAICGLILTSRRVWHCFCRGVEEHSDAYEGDREEKVPCHVRTS